MNKYTKIRISNEKINNKILSERLVVVVYLR